MKTDLILKLPVEGMFYGGLATGLALGFNNMNAEGPGADVRFLGQIVGGSVLAGGGLLGAMSFERKVGPYATRYAVNGAEQITTRAVNLNWASKSGRLGALAAGIGGALMMTSTFGIGRSSGGDGMTQAEIDAVINGTAPDSQGPP